MQDLGGVPICFPRSPHIHLISHWEKKVAFGILENRQDSFSFFFGKPIISIKFDDSLPERALSQKSCFFADVSRFVKLLFTYVPDVFRAHKEHIGWQLQNSYLNVAPFIPLLFSCFHGRAVLNEVQAFVYIAVFDLWSWWEWIWRHVTSCFWHCYNFNHKGQLVASKPGDVWNFCHSFFPHGW